MVWPRRDPEIGNLSLHRYSRCQQKVNDEEPAGINGIRSSVGRVLITLGTNTRLGGGTPIQFNIVRLDDAPLIAGEMHGTYQGRPP